MDKLAPDRRKAGAAPAPAPGGAPRVARPSDLVSSKVLRLANVLRRSSTLVYRARLGLGQIEWRIVALVGEHGPISLNALAELMDVDKGQASRGVSALVARGLLLRQYRRGGRGVEITLAGPGLRLYDDLMASASERNRLLLEGLSETERTQLFLLLDRLTAAARGILQREQGT
jgi:DNA-binding MarR family transcriptional regulator